MALPLAIRDHDDCSRLHRGIRAKVTAFHTGLD
jgi:hypothetical protein